MFLKYLVTVSSPELPAFGHRKLWCLQTLCWLHGERSLPIGLLVLKSEGDIVKASILPSVFPSVRPFVMLSPPKPLGEIQPNLVCELLTCMGRATSNFFGPAPWGPGEGSKGQIFNFNFKVNFKDFYTKLCVCSHKLKIQNISDGIFILSPGSGPRGGTLGCCGVPRWSKFFFSNMVMWHIKSTGMTNRTEYK